MEDKIIFISTPSCGKCKIAKSMIPSTVDVEYWDANQHEEFCQEAGIYSVPALMINGEIYKDFPTILRKIKEF